MKSEARVQHEAQALAENIINGNLTDSIDKLMSFSQVDAVLITTALIEELCLQRLRPTSEATSQIRRLVRRWEEIHNDIGS